MVAKMLVAGLALFVLCRPANAEEIRVGGGGAALSGFFTPFIDTFSEETGLNFSVHQSTPLEGLVALQKGLLDIATAAVPFEDLIGEAHAKGVTVDRSNLHVEQIGKNRTCVFINRTNPVHQLNKAQLIGIFTGRLTNWKQLGGESRKIVVVWGRETPGQNALFQKLILDGETITKDHVPARDYSEIREKVTQDPGAIGIDPEGFIDGQVQVVKAPEISAPVIVMTKGAESSATSTLIRFIRNISHILD